MTCDEVRELLELYALGVLDRDEQIEVAGHLAGDCRHCIADLRKAVALNAAVLATVDEKAVSPALRRRVLSSINPSSSGVAPVSRWIWAGLAAAGLAVATWRTREQGEFIATLQREARESRRDAERLNAAMSFLRDPQTRPAGAASVTLQPRGSYFISPRGVLLIASNLPQLRAGQTYEMWVIPKGQSPSPAGLFRPDNSGGAVHFVQRPVDLANAQALAITVEPESGSAAPTTTPLLVTPLAGI